MLSFELWSVNRWLRWIGFRLFVEVDEIVPTKIGIMYAGLPGTKKWKKWEV